MKSIISNMGTGYLRAYMGNTWRRDPRTNAVTQHPEVIYAPNENELWMRIEAWRKAQRSR